jgi:TolB-like protein
MSRMHRTLLAAVLVFAAARGTLSAQSAGDTINRNLEELSQVLIESFNQLERHEFRNRLAVMEFENASELARQQNLGRVFSEILTDYLSQNAGMFDVYERGQLDSVLREQELALSDLADPEEAIEIGKLTGAHLLVLGSVFQVGNDVQVVARMVETETGQILVSHSVAIPKEVFVDITQYLVELRNSVMLDYMFMFAADGEVSTLALAYRYSFSRGLSLAFQVFLGGNHGIISTTTALGSDPFEWESGFTATGLAVLFGLGSSAQGPVRWELRFGPALAAYHDETLLV